MTDRAGYAEEKRLRERRIQTAQAMRATGASAVLISRAIGVGIATTRKYLAQGVIDEGGASQKSLRLRKREHVCAADVISNHRIRAASFAENAPKP